jgi:hypothetical protein
MYVMLVKKLPDGELQYAIMEEKILDNMVSQMTEANKVKDIDKAYV